MGRKIGAGVLGVICAGLLVAATQWLGHQVYPVPPELDMTDLAEFRAFVSTLPVGALLFVMFSYMVGTFGGGYLSSWIVRDNFRLYTGIVGALVLLNAAITFVRIPHPLWFSMLSVLAIIATTYLTREVARRTLTTTTE